MLLGLWHAYDWGSPSGVWSIFESFEQSPPSLGASVTGQYPNTEVVAQYFDGTLTRETTNVIDGTYSWRNNFSLTTTEAGMNLYISPTSGTIDLSAYTQLRVTFTVDALTNVSGTSSYVRLEVYDGLAENVVAIVDPVTVGQHVLTVSFADNPLLDLSDINIFIQASLTSLSSTSKIMDVYVDAVEVFGVFDGAYDITPTAGVFTLSGVSTSLEIDRVGGAQVGAFTLSGAPTNVSEGVISSANTGAFTLSGVAADLDATRLATAGAGSFVLSGVTTDLYYGKTATASAGAYSLSGVDAALSVQLAPPLAAAQVGAFTLSGISATLGAAKLITSSVGTFTVSGQDASLERNYAAAAGAGAFTLSGVNVALSPGKLAPASAGSFTFSGISSDLKIGYKPVFEVGSFDLSGQNTQLAYNIFASAGAGSFALSGVDTTFTYYRRILAEVGSFRLSRTKPLMYTDGEVERNTAGRRIDRFDNIF